MSFSLLTFTLLLPLSALPTAASTSTSTDVPLPGLHEPGPPAGPDLRSERPRRERPGKWYGWQILIGDLAIPGLVVAGVYAVGRIDAINPAVVSGLVLWNLYGPVVHLLHDNPKSSMYSLLVRLGAQVAIIGVGHALADSRDYSPVVVPSLILLAGTGIDAALFSREPGRARSTERSTSPTPFVTSSDDNTVFGVSGRF